MSGGFFDSHCINYVAFLNMVYDRIVQGRYEQSMVRIVQDGTNSPRYEQSKVRIVREPIEWTVKYF